MHDPRGVGLLRPGRAVSFFALSLSLYWEAVKFVGRLSGPLRDSTEGPTTQLLPSRATSSKQNELGPSRAWKKAQARALDDPFDQSFPLRPDPKLPSRQ